MYLKATNIHLAIIRFTILDDSIGVTNLNNFKPIIKRFTDVINDFYKGGMTKVSPKDSDK